MSEAIERKTNGGARATIQRVRRTLRTAVGLVASTLLGIAGFVARPIITAIRNLGERFRARPRAT